MQDTRQWISSKNILPSNNQKVYYYSSFLGMFRGEYFYDENSKGNPHKFYSEHGIVDADDVSYWMPYDHAFKDMIPLPPNYIKSNSLNEVVEIPEQYRNLVFSYELIGDINNE